jgi:hypothetical protein
VALVALSGTQWHSWHSVALGGTRWHTAALRVPPGGLPSFPTDVTLERVLGILACTAHAVTSPRRLHTRGPRIALGRLTHLGCMQFLEVLGIIAQVIFHVRRRRFRVKARLQEGESHQVTSSLIQSKSRFACTIGRTVGSKTWHSEALRGTQKHYVALSGSPATVVFTPRAAGRAPRL